MGNIGLPGILILALLVLLLFGRNRFSNMMGDVAKGLKSFKKGMAEEEENPERAPPRQLPREEESGDTIEGQATREGDPAPPR